MIKYLLLFSLSFPAYSIPRYNIANDHSQTTVVIKCGVPIAASISNSHNFLVGSMLSLSLDKQTLPALAVTMDAYYIVLDCNGEFDGVAVKTR